MYKYLFNTTRTIYPRLDILITNSNNYKKKISYPIARGDWMSKFNYDYFKTSLHDSSYYRNDSTNTLYLDKELKEILIYSYDFDRDFKHYVRLEHIPKTLMRVKFDNNSDTLTYLKIF